MNEQQMKTLSDRCLKWYAPVTNWLIKKGLKFDEFKEQPVPAILTERKTPVSVAGVLHFEMTRLPLPIISHDVAGNKLSEDTTMAEVSLRKVGELIEQTTLGLNEKLYGFLNHPSRLTSTERNVARARQSLIDLRYYGPYVLVEYRERFSVEDASDSVREIDRLTSPFMPKDRSILFQATPDVIRIIIGEYPCLKQVNGVWRAEAIVVPQLRTDAEKNLGVVDMINISDEVS